MNTDPLVTTLLDLNREINRADFKMILGGGFGLYLNQIHRQKQNDLRTLIPGDLWPYPRATEDLDVFLPTELVIDLEQMQAMRSALDRLGFAPVADAKFLHFSKPWGGSGRVKIDMLTGPIVDPESLAKIQIKGPRVRPLGNVQLHAYLTDEAIDFDRALVPIVVDGVGSDGRRGSMTVFIPQPFTFLLMKLHAFSDRTEDPNKDLGRHHALDVYRIVAMLTEGEYDEVRASVTTHTKSQAVERARQIVSEGFSSATAIGITRLREHSLFTAAMDPNAMIRALADLLR